MSDKNEPTPTDTIESAQTSLKPNLPVPPAERSFPGNKEEEFNKLCKGLRTPIQIIPKKDIVWNPKDPLHLFHSLAFVLQSESLPRVAVSSFTDIQGATKLYIASDETIAESQQKEITEIINLFLEMKAAKEIVAKVLPRQMPYIINQLKKISAAQLDAFVQDYPGELSLLIEKLLYGFKQILTLEDIQPLLKLIWAKRRDLRLMKAGTMENKTEATKRMAFHLCKMVKILEEIGYVAKIVKLHQADASLKSLSKPFQFIENRNNCHAELAILKTAYHASDSKTHYIGVSTRPCYCCSLLFKAVAESQRLKFNIVRTNGKLYGNWNKIEGFLVEEFSLVWAKVIAKRSIIEKSHIQMVTDNISPGEVDSVFIDF